METKQICRWRHNFPVTRRNVGFYSAIHRAVDRAVPGFGTKKSLQPWMGELFLWRAFLPAAGNLATLWIMLLAQLFAYTALFTKPSDCLLRARTVFRDRSPIHSIRDFREWYQASCGTAGSRETSGFMNSTVISTVVLPANPVHPFPQ